MIGLQPRDLVGQHQRDLAVIAGSPVSVALNNDLVNRVAGNLDLPRQVSEAVIQCVSMRVGGGHGDATRVF